MPLANDFTMTIDGRAVVGSLLIDVIDPATGAVFAHAPNAGQGELDAAVSAARRAFPAWAALSADQRKARLSDMAGRIRERSDELKRLLTHEQGKPLADAEWEISVSAAWCAGAAALDLPVTVNEDNSEHFSETRHLPVGVVALEFSNRTCDVEDRAGALGRQYDGS